MIISIILIKVYIVGNDQIMWRASDNFVMSRYYRVQVCAKECRLRVVPLAPRISRGYFLLAVFFRVTHDGLSERGTPRSLETNMMHVRGLSGPVAKELLSQ